MNILNRHTLIFCGFFIFFSFSVVNNSSAQTFWTEEFSNTNTLLNSVANGYVSIPNGTWTVTTLPGTISGDENLFYISCKEAGMVAGNCGDVCPLITPPPPTPYIAQSLHIGPNFGGSLALGDNGAAYNAGDGGAGFFDCTTELRAESPVINCSGQSGITLSFNYLEFGDGAIDNAEVWYSANGGVAWSLLSNMSKTFCGDGTGGPCNVVPCGAVFPNPSPQGIWTNFSIALPATANNNANVKIGFRWVNDNDGVGSDPSFAVTKIELSTPSTANTITPDPLGVITGPFCEGDVITLPFTSTGTFTGGNVYTAQLSNSTGVFPVLPAGFLGSLTSTANSGNISITIPPGTPTGAGYLIQISSDSPVATSTTIGPFTINASAAASEVISLGVGFNDTICAGAGVCVGFSSLTGNGGSVPTYQWNINGVAAPAPSTASTFNYCNFANGDIVTLVMTSNLACVTGSPITSNPITITVTNSLPFSVSLTPNPLVICPGDPITLTANPVNGGVPTYSWSVDGTLLPGVNTQTVTYNGVPIPVVNGMEICAISTSSLVGCVTGSPDTACVTVSFQTGLVPAVSIVADTNSICSGGLITFTASPINGGTAPLYQWFSDGQPVGGFNSNATFAVDSNSVVCVKMISSLGCGTGDTASSNCITAVFLPLATPGVTIVPSTGICKGQDITFGATLSFPGNSPLITWYVNRTTVIGTGGLCTVNSATLTDGDSITCRLISNYPCKTAGDDTVTSAVFKIKLLDAAIVDLGPDVSILYGETFNMDATISGLLINAYLDWSPDSTLNFIHCLNIDQCLNPDAFPLETTSYRLFYRDTKTGCYAIDSINIEVKPNYNIFIPSAFSPNGDQINDVFYVRGPYIKGSQMKIWDRTGGVVFESAYNSFGWDGTKNYWDLNTGVYIYNITVEFLDGTSQDFHGNITLSR